MKHLLFFITLIFAGSAPAFADDSVVVLPKVNVVGEHQLPDMEHWRYTQIPGYEILSQCSDAKTTACVNLLNRMEVTLRHVWAPAVKLEKKDTIVILCDGRSTFDSFIPEKVGQVFAKDLVDRLFLHTRDQHIVVLYMGGFENGETFRADLLKDHIERSMDVLPTQPPAWLLEGLCQIIADMGSQTTREGQVIFTAGKLQQQVGSNYDADSDPGQSPGGSGTPGENVGPASAPSASELSKADPEVLDIVQGVADKMPDGTETPKPKGESVFKTYYTNRHMPSLKEVLANDPGDSPTDWKMMCEMFVHFCIFGEKGSHQAELTKFLQLCVQNPAGDRETLFKQAFGQSFFGMQVRLRGYVDVADYRAINYKVDGHELAISPEIRDATDAEIGRIKGDAYLLADLSGPAREQLTDTFRREVSEKKPHDPEILASLGLLEAKAGDKADAKLYLQAAAAAKLPRAEIYNTLARLSLEQAGAGPLTVQQTADCLAPLFTARDLCRPSAETYELIAQVWTRSSATPLRGHLAVLDEGVLHFPADIDLILSAAELNAKFNYTEAAQALAVHGLKVAGTPETKARFAALIQPPAPAAAQ